MSNKFEVYQSLREAELWLNDRLKADLDAGRITRQTFEREFNRIAAEYRAAVEVTLCSA